MLFENMLMPKNLPSLLQFQCQQCRITAASSGQSSKNFLTVMSRKKLLGESHLFLQCLGSKCPQPVSPSRGPWGCHAVEAAMEGACWGGSPSVAFRCAVSCRDPIKPSLGSWHLRTPHKRGEEGLSAGTPAGGTYSVVFCYKKLFY